MTNDKLKLILWVTISTFALSWGSVAGVFFFGGEKKTSSSKRPPTIDSDVELGSKLNVVSSGKVEPIAEFDIEQRKKFKLKMEFSRDGRLAWVNRPRAAAIQVELLSGKVKELEETEATPRGGFGSTRFALIREPEFYRVFDTMTKRTNYRLESNRKVAEKNRISDLQLIQDKWIRFEVFPNIVACLDLKRGKILSARKVKPLYRLTASKEEKRIGSQHFSEDLRYRYHVSQTNDGLVYWAYDEVEDKAVALIQTKIKRQDNPRILGWSANRRYSILAISNGLLVFDLVAQKEICSFEKISSGVTAITISNNGKHIALIEGGILKMMDVATGDVRTLGTAFDSEKDKMHVVIDKEAIAIAADGSHVAFKDWLNMRLKVFKTGVKPSEPPKPVEPYFFSLPEKDQVDAELELVVREVLMAADESVFVE